ncbi:MAG: ImmA/IrrE family metallo-endopeptidase, partial [Rhodospirillales bacterium]|nr:ImmA/IrrE family metallo-endopeptidase [Rhodospirillales bacterium]
CELGGQHPKIQLIRRSDAEGVMPLSPHQEHLLSPRERFSVAHELGHCLAFTKFNVKPLQRDADRTEYREQEECMDDFASSLLVPAWLSDRWLSRISGPEPVAISQLLSWAAKECKLSGHVVALALTRAEPSIGFLKLAEAIRTADKKRFFIVFYSCYGNELHLPNQHAYISYDDDDKLAENIQTPHGARQIESWKFNDSSQKKLQIAWVETRTPTSNRRQEFKARVRLTGRAYWVSVRSDPGTNLATETDPVQLGLFESV